MRKISFAFFCLLFLRFPAASALGGEVEYTVDLTSRYIWRGFDVYPDNTPAFQPDINLSFGESGWSLDLWSSFALERRDRFRELDEVNITLAYDIPLESALDFEAGMILYAWFFEPGFSFEESSTFELFLSVGLTQVPFSPSVIVYYDFHLGKGAYIQARGGKSWPLASGFALELTGGLGYNGSQWIEEAGISDLQWGLALPVTVKKWRVSVSLNGVWVFLDSINRDHEFWVGFSLGSRF